MKLRNDDEIPSNTHCRVSVSKESRPGSNSSRQAKMGGRRKHPEMMKYEWRNIKDWKFRASIKDGKSRHGSGSDGISGSDGTWNESRTRREQPRMSGRRKHPEMWKKKRIGKKTATPGYFQTSGYFRIWKTEILGKWCNRKQVEKKTGKPNREEGGQITKCPNMKLETSGDGVKRTGKKM